MKLTSEQLKLVQECTTAEELVSKAEGVNLSLTHDQAQKVLDANVFAEIGEDDLGMIAGGGCIESCCMCGLTELEAKLYEKDGKCYCAACLRAVS